MKFRLVAIVGCLAALGLVTPAVEAATFSEVYEFGDSLLDVGNFFAVTSGSAPLGETPSPVIAPFPGPPYPGAPYFNGRFSNGPLWHEYVEQGLGIASSPSTNVAFGGATSGNLHVQWPAPLGLRSQVNGFTAGGSADPDALYLISAGANDYSNPFAVTPQTIADTVANITTSVVDLSAVGASSFVVLSLPNLGAIPSGSIAPVPLSALTQAHNAALASSMAVLDANPALDVLFLDISTIFDEAIANPDAFGFTNVTDPCFDLATLTTCARPDEYLFWDFMHPSAAAHEILGAYALAEIQSHSVPEPTMMLGFVALGVLGVRRWQRHGKQCGS